ncbi:MAG TPA: penicillin-binding protein 2 [Blastocatellia bacterium]|nr:penicillin-binding protein 2 [Blastocatellia bacterium]
MSKGNPNNGSRSFELRLYVFQYLILAIFVALGVRFYFLQVGRHQYYEQQAENNRIREIPIIAARGAILDRNGTLLVDSTPVTNIVVYPELITNRDETISALVDNMGVDRTQLLADLNDPKRPKSQPVLVKQNASVADRSWSAAHDYEHPEIQMDQEPQRLYKYGELAANVIGYIGEVSSKELEDPRLIEEGYKPGDIVGKGGIEKTYDKILRGKNGMRRVVVDSRGRPIRELERVEPIKGQDLITTLDIDVQRVAEAQFDDARQTGAAIAEDPQTGEIIAMVSKPSFDPNAFAQNMISTESREDVSEIITDPAHPLLNKAIQGIYPTGSTWKIMMATAGLEEGVITLKNSRIVCGGGIQVGNRFVHCMGNHGAPDIHAAIVHSCDGYFYRLGLKLGVDKIHDWVTRFGMGQKTGIDLPSEVKGIIPDREWKKRVNPADPVWKDFDTVEAAVGQGSVAVTPIQLLRAECGIMMGGEYHVPHILKEAKGTSLAREVDYSDQPRELALSKSTVDAITYAAWGVVNEGGTAGGVGFPRDLNVGGKTGTAQVIAREKAHGNLLKDHSWFISFAPLHTDQKPQLAVVVLTEHGGFGAQSSAPKSKMINAAFFSKKLGHSVLPDLVAKDQKIEPAEAAVKRPVDR